MAAGDIVIPYDLGDGWVVEVAYVSRLRFQEKARQCAQPASGGGRFPRADDVEINEGQWVRLMPPEYVKGWRGLTFNRYRTMVDADTEATLLGRGEPNGHGRAAHPAFEMSEAAPEPDANGYVPFTVTALKLLWIGAYAHHFADPVVRFSREHCLRAKQALDDEKKKAFVVS